MVMNNTTYSFTPVRRRKAEFEEEDSNADSKNWTAARCNRLLRSLTSRIELLKKDAARFMPASRSTDPAANYIAVSTERERNSRPVNADDHDRAGLKPRKRVRITYSGKSRPKGQEGGDGVNRLQHTNELKHATSMISRPAGEVSVATPFLIRSRPEEGVSRGLVVEADGLERMIRTKASKSRQPRFLRNAGQSSFQSKHSLRQLKATMNTEKYTLSSGIYNALETLLRSTEQVPPQAPSRSNSLLSVCLRSMHRRIKLEEDWEAIDVDVAGLKSTLQKRDVSGEMYSELEGLGTSELGWKHLRPMVRAHGIQIISEAIEGGLVDRQFGAALVMLCLHMDSPLEAEALLNSLLLTIPTVEPATPYSRFAEIPEMSPLSTLEDFVTYTGHNSAYFRILAHLFRSKVLAIQWLATKEFGTMWTRVFRALSKEPACQNATEFLETVLPLMSDASARHTKKRCITPETEISVAIGTTFSSVLAALSAVVVLDENIALNGQGSYPATERGKNVAKILRYLQIGYLTPSAEYRGDQSSLVFLANLLTTPPKDAGDEKCVQNIKLLQQSCQGSCQAIDPQISEFLCSVARCCGRGVSNNGFEYIQRFSLFVEACSSLPEAQKSHVLRDIIVDSAYVFAQQLPTTAHLDYATDIRAKFQTHHVLSQRLSPSIKPEVAFRWEEGISEWVAPTPALPPKQIKYSADPVLDHDSEIDSPLPLYRRIRVPHAPSLSTKGGHKLAQHPPRRVSDLIPSSPSNLDCEGEDSKYEEEESIFSDKSSHSSLTSLSAGECTELRIGANKEIQRRGRLGNVLPRHSGGWDLFGNADSIKGVKDNDQEDELGSTSIHHNEKPSILAELPNNTNRRLGVGQRQINLTVKGKESSQNINDSEDELGF